MANSITEVGLFYDQIPNAPAIETVSYENFFKLHVVNSDGEDYIFFNLLKKINLLSDSNDFNPLYFNTFNIDVDIPWVTISYNLYNTLNLWWLVCLCNNITDPTKNPQLGTTIKALKPKYVNFVIESIKAQLVE